MMAGDPHLTFPPKRVPHVSRLRRGFAGRPASNGGHGATSNPHLFEMWGTPFWLTMRIWAARLVRSVAGQMRGFFPFGFAQGQNDTSKDLFCYSRNGNSLCIDSPQS